MTHLPGMLRAYATLFQRRLADFTMGGRWANAHPITTQKNLRNFWLDGLFANASDAIILTYLPLYMLAMQASQVQIGLMSALSSLSATLLLLPGALAVERLGKRKPVTLFAGGIGSRAMVLLLVLAPFFVQNTALIWFAMGLAILREALGNLALPAWIALSADLVPLNRRGRYFASRNIVMSIAGMATILWSGQIITSRGGVEGYQLALLLAFGLGLVSTFFFARLYEPSIQPRPTTNKVVFSASELLSPLRSSRPFLLFCVFAAIWNFALNISGPFFSVFMAQDLGLSASTIGFLSIFSSLSGLPAQRLLGPLADRLGPRRVQMITGLLIPILPLGWAFVTQPWQIIVLNLIGGFMWAGFSLASFNMLLDLTPENQRARASALYQIVVSISLAAGAAFGGVGVSLWGFRFAFLCSAVGRWIAAGLFVKFIKDTVALPPQGPPE